MRPRAETGGAKSREAGFSLIELLVVVFIIAIIAMVLTINVSTTLKKQRLETAARQLQSFIERAYVVSAERSRGVFVVISPNPAASPYGAGSWTVFLVTDTNANDILDFNPAAPAAGPDLPVTEDVMIITQDMALSPQPPTWGGLNNWPAVGGGPAAGSFVLLCDPRGLPFNPTAAPAAQISQLTRISLTHQEMLAGVLHPRFRYDITVSPLWHSSLDRVMF